MKIAEDATLMISKIRIEELVARNGKNNHFRGSSKDPIRMIFQPFERESSKRLRNVNKAVVEMNEFAR